MTRHRTAFWLASLAVAGGCGSSTSGVGTVDASIRHDLLTGVAQIRATHDRKKLRAELTLVLANLHRDRRSTPSARRARELAIQGFEATLRGVRSQLDFSENDSGEVAAATRDAMRADRFLRQGADRLRAAGRALGIQIGTLNGF
ncbi:MAG: hypothetical protein ACM3QU_10260 [Verrucomicrobiota bacterium]